MKEVGLTQERLAEAFDMTPAGMQKWLAGTRQPALEDIDRIAAALGVPGAYLTHGVTADDLCTDLAEPGRSILRRLIALQRADTAPEALWSAIEQTLKLATGSAPQKPLGAPIAPEHEAHIRELAEDAERQHKEGRPRRRVSSG